MLLGIDKDYSIHTAFGWKGVRFAVCMMLLLALTACSDDAGLSDLHSYARGIKSKPAARIPPLPEFKMYETFSYSAIDLRDPFLMFENEAEIVSETSIYAGPKPDENRNKETLEQYPLDTLRFVGQLEKDNENWAIVTSPDRLVHRVKAGNYIGQNFGRITEVTETEMNVTELVSDGMGGWIEREAALSLGN